MARVGFLAVRAIQALWNVFYSGSKHFRLLALLADDGKHVPVAFVVAASRTLAQEVVVGLEVVAAVAGEIHQVDVGDEKLGIVSLRKVFQSPDDDGPVGKEGGRGVWHARVVEDGGPEVESSIRFLRCPECSRMSSK